jgi:hypothetical protein
LVSFGVATAVASSLMWPMGRWTHILSLRAHSPWDSAHDSVHVPASAF